MPLLNLSVNRLQGPRLFDEFDAGGMTGGPGQAAVTGDQWYVEYLREGDIHSVIRRNIPTERPDAREKWSVRVACHRKGPKERDGHLPHVIADLIVKPRSPDHVSDFCVEELRRVKAFSSAEESLQRGRCAFSAEKNLRRD
jgi:hypothetical protein